MMPHMAASKVLTVIVEQCLAPVPGGTGRYAAEITAALAASAPAGWRVRTVTAWHRDVQQAEIAGAGGPHRLPAGHRVLNQLWRRGLPPWVRGTALQATTPLAPGRQRNAVVTVHDAVPWTHPETLSPRGVTWHRVTVGRAMTNAKAIAVPSRAVADDLAGLFPAASDRIVVVPHGVTPLRPPPDATQRRARLGLSGRYFLSVATLEPRKGLDVLIAALALPAAGDATLAIAGQPGWGGVDLVSLAGAAGIAPERLRLLGRLHDEDLASAMQGATALVAPSRSEGFGLPVLEAFAAGVPVICSDAPALVELSGGAALVVPREDPAALAGALGSLSTDPDAASEMRERGIRRAAAFSWSTAAERLWELHLGDR
jgi:glycosyltransferase involved in cell wall biosynthesis